MNKTLNYLYTFVVLASGYCLLTIKTEVQDLGYQLTNVSTQIQKEQNDLNILKAEFAYLSSPNRLQAFATNHLTLSKVSANQISKDPLTQEQQIVNPQPQREVKLSAKKISWRYKHNKQNNVHTASYQR
jgi:cell division protein FtsL